MSRNLRKGFRAPSSPFAAGQPLCGGNLNDPHSWVGAQSEGAVPAFMARLRLSRKAPSLPSWPRPGLGLKLPSLPSRRRHSTEGPSWAFALRCCREAEVDT